MSHWIDHERSLAGLPPRHGLKFKALTGVSAIISAAHRDADGNMHGHTWEIIVWFEEILCAIKRQEELRDYLKIFDHQVLNENISWGESLGRSICLGMNAAKVEVRRPMEGIFASVEVVK